MPVGVDVVEPAMLFEPQAVGLEVRDGRQADIPRNVEQGALRRQHA
jgi:hypothetical protein